MDNMVQLIITIFVIGYFADKFGSVFIAYKKISRDMELNQRRKPQVISNIMTPKPQVAPIDDRPDYLKHGIPGFKRSDRQ